MSLKATRDHPQKRRVQLLLLLPAIVALQANVTMVTRTTKAIMHIYINKPTTFTNTSKPPPLPHQIQHLHSLPSQISLASGAEKSTRPDPTLVICAFITPHLLHVLAAHESLSKQFLKGRGLLDGVKQHVHLQLPSTCLHQLRQTGPGGKGTQSQHEAPSQGVLTRGPSPPAELLVPAIKSQLEYLVMLQN